MIRRRTEPNLRWPTLGAAGLLLAGLAGCSLNPQPLPPGQADGSLGHDSTGGFELDAGKDAFPNQSAWPDGGGGSDGGTGATEDSFEAGGGEGGLGEGGFDDAPAE